MYKPHWIPWLDLAHRNELVLQQPWPTMQYKENLLKVTQIAVDGPKDLQASPMQKIRVV